jgi:hypothetical protein
MKTFNLKEQQILEYIVRNRNSNTFVLANVFNQWFDQTGVSFNVDTGAIIYDLNGDVDIDRILKDEHGIIEVALLVKYLVDKGYIYVIKDSKGEIDIKKLGKNLSGTNIFHTLPNDIVTIIKQSLYRVFVANDLVELVNNEFQSIETRQMLLAISQLTQAQEQLNVSQKQLTEVRKQTCELKKQTNEIVNQTKEVHSQLEEAKLQTQCAETQSQEAKEQTKRAKQQTGLAWGALICAIVTVIVTIVVPFISDDDKCQKDILLQLNHINGVAIQSNNNLDSINNNLDSIKYISSKILKQNERIQQTTKKRNK